MLVRVCMSTRISLSSFVRESEKEREAERVGGKGIMEEGLSLQDFLSRRLRGRKSKSGNTSF